MEPGLRRFRPVELSSSTDPVFKWPSSPSSSSSSSSSSSRPTCRPPKPSDYAEIFGGFAASCSIPVLDLPPPVADEDNFTTIDYFDIFGGFEATGLGVSYEELFFPREDLRNPQEIGAHGQSTAFNGFSKKDLTGEKNLFSNEGIKTLNGGIGKFNLPHQKPKHGSEESTVTGGTDVSGSLNCTAELAGVVGSNFRNAKSPTSLTTGTKSSSDDHYSDQKLPEMKISPEDTSPNDQYHSCSSSNQSSVETDASFPFQSNAYEYSSVDNNDAIEENCVGMSTSTASTSSIIKNSVNKTGNDQKQSTAITITSEKTTPFQHLHTHSNPSDDKSAFSMGMGIVNSFNGQGTVYNEKTNYQSQNPEFIMGKVEEKMPMKSVVPKSSVFMVRNAENYLKEDQKQDFATASEDPHVNNQPHEDRSNNLSVSIDERSMPSSYATFLTVSDINLQTQPSQVPPPTRPAPRVYNDQGPTKLRKAESLKTHSDKSGYRHATCRRTNSLIGVSYTSKETGRNDSPPFFDVDMDVSSAAAVSVAAMKEAMEQAQARLKSAKESMERKKDSLQGRKKSVPTEVSRNKDPKLVETIETSLGSKHQKILENSENNCNRTNVISNDQRKKNSGVGSVASDLEANEKYFDLGEESLQGTKGEETKARQVSYIQDARAGEWNVEEQFFELVNNNKPRKQEFYEHEAERKKTKACFKSNEEKVYEQTTNVVGELKDNDTFFTVDGDKEERSNNRILVGDGNNKVKDSCKVVEVDGKEGPRQTQEVRSQEGKESIEEHSFGQHSDGYNKQQQDHINVKQNPISSGDANTVEEYRSDESSRPCFLGALPEYKIEELKAKSSIETHLTNKIDDICVDKEQEHVINVSDNDSVVALDESSIISGREPKLCDTGREQVASQQEFCEVKNEDAVLTETMNSCENICIIGEDEQVLQEDVMLEKEDIQKLTRIQESCKPTESNQRTKEDCIKKQDMGVLDAVEKSIPCTENNKENETNEGASWQYFCEKIIRKTQVDIQQKEEKQNPAKVDDELNPQRNHEVGVDELEVASTSLEKSSTRMPSIKGGQSLNGMKREHSEHTVVLDPPNNMQKASQTVAEPDSDKNCNDIDEMLKPEEKTRKERVKMEMEQEKERIRKIEEEKEREREREKDRLAFERASQEARDRAISETWERTERAAVERANGEARHRALAEAREKAERASNEALLVAEKASQEAKLKAERAAVERATAEARERAIERALAEKARKEAKEHAERSNSTGRDKQRKDNEANVFSKEATRMRHSSSFSDMKDFPSEQRYSDPSNNGWKPESESAIRCKARLERHQRTVERAAKALAEKNLRDILVQREQAERNRIAETLDADVRRWSNGKEGNLRALLSTLQYILGPESGWQPIPLTDVITAAAVKKAYRKATLCVHPDKLQQRGASIQQKYICEKVFDLLKDGWKTDTLYIHIHYHIMQKRLSKEERCKRNRVCIFHVQDAWSRFNSEER